MFKLFQKRKVSFRQHQITSPVNRQLQVWLQALSDKLKASTDKLGTGTLKAVVLAGGITISLLLIKIVATSMYQQTAAPLVEEITVPVHAAKRQITKSKVWLSDSELAAIKGFQHYLDSLRETHSGRVMLDSLRMARPGLIDSLHYIENYYYQQFQK